MKKIVLAFTLIGALVSCKKETTTPNTNVVNKTSDSTITISSNTASIIGFECGSQQITGTLKKGELASNVSVTLNYTGGNGKTYTEKSYTSTVVTGLTATLSEGTLISGNGKLKFAISGTPSTNGTASFTISFGGKICTINLIVSDAVKQPTSGYGPNITDVDGNKYKTVYIGTQQWMAENLKTSKYSNGTAIQNVPDNKQWSNLTTGAWVYYNNEISNNAKYGKLYNWYAINPTANGNVNICPMGWHIPTDNEWTVLIDYLGEDAGSKMKETSTTNWDSPNDDATNSSLFTGLPGGYRSIYGYYNTIGVLGNWWSSTESIAGNIFFWLYNGNGGVNSSDGSKRTGYSIRCLKD